eukprot:gene3853-biopygen3282
MNRGLAEGRLNNQLKKLKKTPDILKEYDAIIQQQLEEGIVERVPENARKQRVTYIPHQAVVREEATTTKMRVVYDASAKVTKGAKSLNECLHTGRSLNPLLFSILLNFRMHAIILMADIKQAFLQIEIEPEDRDAMRFPWVKNATENDFEIEEFRFTRTIFGAGPRGFCLRKWFSNDAIVREKINEEATKEQRKVFGVTWQPSYDILLVDLNLTAPPTPVTRKSLLSCLSSAFDPLGLAGPVILKARLVFQSICARELDWNEELPAEEQAQFQSWLQSVQEMKRLAVPRRVLSAVTESTANEMVLHVFCDASKLGYCAAAYIVPKCGEEITSRLLTAKCGLAPLKKITIPRLEPLSAVTGARLARVKEIHETIPKATWYHCLTAINPSDMGTRGVTASRLQHSPLWWEGPTFLKREKEHWPKQPANFQPDEEANTEERSPTLTVVNEGSIKLTEAINLRIFSSLGRLLGCVARMKRFIDNCRKAKDSRVTSQGLSIEELRETREWIVKAMRKDMKGDAEYEARTRDLGVYLHTDGFIRCGGRLKNTSLTFDQKHPILLPIRHKVTELVVKECHQSIGHEKVSRTWAEVRAQFQYWIPRCRQLVKSVIKWCQQYRLLSGSHLNAPEMAPFPDTRVVRTRPFQHTGVDLAGRLSPLGNWH